MPPRMRTIQEAAAELRKIDPGTAVTPYRIRQLVLDGTIPHVKAGNKLGTDVCIAGKNRAQAGQQEHVIKT